jgi:threonyl-tRNA synthetase
LSIEKKFDFVVFQSIMSASEAKPKQQQQKKKQQKKQQQCGQKKQAARKKQQPAAPKEPVYWAERLALFEKLYAEQQVRDAASIETAKQADTKIAISLADGRQLEGVAGVMSARDVAQQIGLIQHALVAKINGQKVVDLSHRFDESCAVEILRFDDAEGRHTFWHSSAHILGQAMELFYGGHLCIGPPIEEGFYYDIAMPEVEEKAAEGAEGKEASSSSASTSIGLAKAAVSSEDYGELQRLVAGFAKKKQPFQRLVLSKADALAMFAYNKYKVAIIESKVPDGESCTAYRCGPLIDLCKGPHIPHTGKIGGFAVTKNSSCYWLGDAANDSLQRVFGIAFPRKKDVTEWQDRKAKEAERDHRRVGTDQQLFFFSPLSPGSPFFLPHGMRVLNRLQDFLRAEYRERGFDEVQTPNVFHNRLFEISGHADAYAENMFHFEVEKQKFAMKPMNCPSHCLMFRQFSRSHRELPIRFADFGVLHRNELSGALSGLTRVRRFCQDDAHIFCAADQVSAEMTNCIAFMQHVYGVFGFEFELELSTRPEHFLGSIDVWNKAEADLAAALDGAGLAYQINAGDGAFYGPKIDVHIRDALGRSFQCATIQLDFQLPERFDLHYMNDRKPAGADADAEQLSRPVIIHRAIYGSFERFFGILIEHTGGKWPFWVSPRQLQIVPVSNKFYDYAEQVYHRLFGAGFYVDKDLSGETLNKKIRAAQLAQYNFILVVGAREQENNTVNIRTRANEVEGEKSLDEAIEFFHQLSKTHQ